jgi:hypothetical protein
MFCFATPAVIRDTIIRHNYADTSGGGLYIAGNRSTAQITNCLITNNGAARDGGGISANWYAMPVVSNCTFVTNAASGIAGEEGNTGLGGGLNVSYHAECFVTDSIFWNNYGLKGHEMAVGTGFEHDPRMGTLVVQYCDVKDGKPDVSVPPGYEPYLIWGGGNINADPLFVDGALDGYYLSHLATGQPAQSPCVDAGSAFAGDIGLVGYTTRIDGAPDTGDVDMGYHHRTLEPCRYCDLVYDGLINFADFAKVADKWLDEGCSDADGWCGGADITFDMRVNFKDVAFVAECWLAEDLSPPLPDPAEWLSEPNLAGATTAEMVAKTAFDSWGWPVEYFFECVRGNCDDSGWIPSSTYTDGGLTAGVRYGYRVKARDTSPRLNETGWSPVAYVGEEDTIPPAALIWIREPIAISPNSVAMQAYAEDASGVQYYFENTTISGHFSGWQDEPNWIDTYLTRGTQYCYHVKARDKSPLANETFWSDIACATTLIPLDQTPPTPDPMQWDADPNLQPTDIWIGPDATFNWAVTMTCVVANDPSGPVQYQFQCVDGPYDSGWINTNTWTSGIVGQRGSQFLLGWHVMARDARGNTTHWSAVATTRPITVPP